MFMRSRFGYTKVTALVVVAALMWATSAQAVMTIKKEKEIGEEILAEALKQIKTIDDPLIASYVEKVGRRALSHIPDKHFDFSFHVADDPTLNAFCLPGGNIFIFRGLIQLMDSEDELAGVLCHEIGHEQARHFAERVDKATVVNVAAIAGALLAVLLGGGKGGSALMTGAMAAGQSLLLQYSRTDEEEADRLGLSYMESGGFDVTAMSTVFKKMLKSQWITSSSFPAYLSTHPGLDERIGYLENAILTHKPIARETTDPTESLKFDEMKARLIAYYEEPIKSNDILTRMMEKKPGASMPYYGMGLLKMRLDNYPEAIRYFNRALELNPSNSNFYRSLGTTYFVSGDLGKAKTSLSQALIYDPDNGIARFYLGRVYGQEGQWKLALDNFEKARVALPQQPDVLYYLALANSKLDRIGEAHLLYGLYSQKEKNVANARFHFRKALDIFRGNAVKTAEVEKYLKELDESKKDKDKDKEKDKGKTDKEDKTATEKDGRPILPW